MEPEEYDVINEPRFPRNSRRDLIQRIAWSSNDVIRSHMQMFLNDIDYHMRQTISNENGVTQNGRCGEIQDVLSRNFIRNLIFASFYQSLLRQYNFWTRRLQEENSDHTVPGIEVSTSLTQPSSLDQVVPCDTNQASSPIRVNRILYQPNINSRRVFGEQVRHVRYRNQSFLTSINTNLNRNLNRNIYSTAFRNSSPDYPVSLTGMRRNGHNQNELSRQENIAEELNEMRSEYYRNANNIGLGHNSFIEQTNVNLSVYCQKRKPKRKMKNYKVRQNFQDCKSRRVYKRACRLDSCQETTELENSSESQLTSSVTQDSQWQNFSTSASVLNVPKRGKPHIRLPFNHKAKFSNSSTSMQTCNKKITSNSGKQNNSNSSPVNSKIPSTSTGMLSSTIAYDSYPESNSNLQSPVWKFSSFSNINMATEQHNFRPQVPQFPNVPTTSCFSNISLQKNLNNDNSSSCFRNTNNKKSNKKENTTGVPLQPFRSSAHLNTMEICAAYNDDNECSSSLNKPVRNMANRKRISDDNIRMDSNAEKEDILFLEKNKNSPHRLSATNMENPHLSLPYFPNGLRDFYKHSASNVFDSTCAPPLHSKTSALEKQSSQHFNEKPHLSEFTPGTKLISSHAENDEIRRLKEINESWEKKRDNVMHENPLKVSSSANVFEKQKSHFLNAKDGEMDCSAATSCDIEQQRTSGDLRNRLNISTVVFPIPAFSQNPEASQSGVFRNRRLLQSSEEESCSKNASNNGRKCSREIIQEKSPVTLKQMALDTPHSMTNNEEMMNVDDPATETCFSIVQPGTRAKVIAKNTRILHKNTSSNPLQPFNENNELISNKPISLNAGKMAEMEINNKEHISKNNQKNRENFLNPFSLNVVNSDMQHAERILMDTYIHPKPILVDSTTSVSYTNLSKDSTSNLRLVEKNQDIETAETNRKTEIENSPLSNFASDSMKDANPNEKIASQKASFKKSEISESFCDKANKPTSSKLNFDKHKISEVVLNGDSDEQVKENIPPHNSLEN